MPIGPHHSPLVKVGNRGRWSKTRQPRNHSDLQLKVEVGLRYLGMKYDTKAEAVKIPEIKRHSRILLFHSLKVSGGSQICTSMSMDSFIQKNGRVDGILNGRTLR